jgi:uncharacterized protein YjiS (DUF1127 family)
MSPTEIADPSSVAVEIDPSPTTICQPALERPVWGYPGALLGRGVGITEGDLTMDSRTAALSRHVQGAPVTTGRLAGVVHAAGRTLARIRHWREVRRNIAFLSLLDDKTLADVGIMRDQLEYVGRLGHLPDQG